MAKEFGFDSHQGQDMFLYFKAWGLGSTQRTIQLSTGTASMEINQPYEADCSPPSRAKVKNGATPPSTTYLHGMVLN
jgi:hypothetical protein